MKTLLDIWFGRNDCKNLTIINFKDLRKENLALYGDDPEANTKRQWGVRTNGAKRGNPKDSCLDWFLNLGHIQINYTNFEFNRRFRRRSN